MHYLNRQWPKLERVLDDGRLPLDTNLVENAIRPFVVGRKNGISRTAWPALGPARISTA